TNPRGKAAMSDEQTEQTPTQTQEKRGRGRPRKQPVEPQQAAPQAELPEWDNKPKKPQPAYVQKFGVVPDHWDGEFVDGQESRMHIPRERVEALAQEGVALQWMTEAVFGQPQDHAMAVHRRNGWQEVQEGEIPGIDTVRVDGLVLMARP